VTVDLDEARYLAEALARTVADQTAGDEKPTAITEEWLDDDTCAKCGEQTIVAHPAVEGEVVCPDCGE
jgi:hypothetical protein